MSESIGTNFWSPQRLERDENTFRLIAPESGCVGPSDHQFFMGGVAMATAVEVLEHWSGKPLLWATIQFLNHGMLGDELFVEVERLSGGRSVIQAMVRMRRDDGVILQQTIAALGAREGEPDRQFATMPSVNPPEICPPKQSDSFEMPGNLIDQFERRTALEDPEAGLEYMWIKPKFGVEMSAPLLALMSDFFLGAHVRSRGGTSLDNTFRPGAIKPTNWVLTTTQYSGFTKGSVSGAQYQFAEDGTVLSTSSQTGLLPRQTR